MTKQSMELLVKKITAEIEGQNWTDQPLTDDERNVIDMAVRATVYDLNKRSQSAVVGWCALLAGVILAAWFLAYNLR